MTSPNKQVTAREHSAQNGPPGRAGPAPLSTGKGSSGSFTPDTKDNAPDSEPADSVVLAGQSLRAAGRIEIDPKPSLATMSRRIAVRVLGAVLSAGALVVISGTGVFKFLSRVGNKIGDALGIRQNDDEDEE